MDTHLTHVLAGTEPNALLPFFWQHGEPEAVLRDEMAKIHASGIGAVCVESRPHPDFAGPLWWRDLDIILDEARRRGMRVWVLDDAHFPTGFANGAVKRHPELAKRYLKECHFEVSGPFEAAAFAVDGWLNRFDFTKPDQRPGIDDGLFAVVAVNTGDPSQRVEMPPAGANGLVRWNVPPGTWRVSVFVTTKHFGGNPDTIDMLNPASVRLLVDAVYEPHWQRYKADFGNTFAGFFFDEPGWGNTRGFAFDEAIGRKDMVLPWSDDVAQALATRLGTTWRCGLPGLWHPLDSDGTAVVRHTYMDAVTRLYQRNFSEQLGGWCRDHGVESIGHVIEDQNIHSRLGCGPGHYFRAMAGQDMAGFDLISQQVYPRYEPWTETRLGNAPDWEFFHFVLAKLGSSHGHLDPLKKGRVLVELFGASGWAEGVKLMKWQLDHVLSRGANVLVPHAFSAQEFPDPDCPPHFYARGHNPQFRFFRPLMEYANRLCHLLSGGVHVAPVALLYHAEAEWTGEYQYVQKPAHELTRNQIDFDLVWADVFSDRERYAVRWVENRLAVNGEEFRALVVPRAQYVTAAVAAFVEEARDRRFPVVFVDAHPDGVCDSLTSGPPPWHGCPTVPLEVLATWLRRHHLTDYGPSTPCPYLRTFRYRRGSAEVYFFFNEHPYDPVVTTLALPVTGAVDRYDAFANQTVPVPGTELVLDLAAYESAVFVVATDREPHPSGGPARDRSLPPAAGHLVAEPWAVSTADAFAYPTFVRRPGAGLGDFDLVVPGFAGTVRYETELPPDARALDLGRAFEAVEVWVDDVRVGQRLTPPYRFAWDPAEGRTQRLRVEVTNTLVHQVHDWGTPTVLIEPSGLLGPVTMELE